MVIFGVKKNQNSQRQPPPDENDSRWAGPGGTADSLRRRNRKMRRRNSPWPAGVFASVLPAG